MKVRPAVGAEGYQLTIDDCLIGKVLQGRRNVREPLVEHILPARLKRSDTALSHYLKPIAIEFDFLCCVAVYVVLHSLTSFLAGSDAFWRNITGRSNSI
jgi:hypothetical protein